MILYSHEYLAETLDDWNSKLMKCLRMVNHISLEVIGY